MSLLSAGVGDIWNSGAFSFESPLKDLLDSGDYTMGQLLAEEELLQELRGVHPDLIHFFSTPEAVAKLVEYVILPRHEIGSSTAANETEESSPEPNGNLEQQQLPVTASVVPRDPGEWLKQYSNGDGKAKSNTPQDDPEMRYVRFPYMACEIICCEIQDVIDKLVDGYVPSPPQQDKSSQEVQQPPMRILDLLFSLLYTTKPGQLDDYRAGYFEKILTVLFRKRPAEVTEYINDGGGKGAETLMSAMFDHLYSHSIMQIAQRLLLPQRPTPPKQPDEQEEGGAEIMASEEQEPQDDGYSGAVRCNWSKSSWALETLLDILIDPKAGDINQNTTTKVVEAVEEQRLDLSLNASEVLITIIQNSMLSSEIMLSLTSPETIKRIIDAATTLHGTDKDDEDEVFFSPHESLLTSAMNVLESLILQLGGYGAVGTMFLLPEDDGQEDLNNESDDQTPKHLIADLASMVEQLPHLLDALSNLLRHPSTKKWTSPMQFFKSTPQLLLGSSRLRIVRVLESLVLLGDPEVDSKLIQSDCLEICLDLFWEFQWCSMLHQSVANLLVHIFEGQNARIEMQEYLLIKCNLLGRLMDSFLDCAHDTHTRMADVVMNLKDVKLNSAGVSSSIASEKGSLSDPLPVSEDDVDAALEKQESETSNAKAGGDAGIKNELISTEAVRFESRDASTIGAAAPAQAFRYGYMGHVIIICQALVHACSNEMDQEEEQMRLENGEPVNSPSGSGDGQLSNEPLLLAELVTNHALASRWSEFVVTTLASETAIQSAPLGGDAGVGPDGLHSHRPGLADEGDILGDDGMGPPAPPRGMLGGGDVIDMDDNDLDIAASMMANLNLTRASPDEDDSSSSNSGSLASGDSEKSYNSGETASEKIGYVFDDPLGKAGALGIELGKLTQYKRAGSAEATGREKAGATKDDDNGSNSSSDEEPDSMAEDGSDDVPVMDLFAGNFDPSFANFEKPEADNFANFENAEEDFGDFASASIEPPESQLDGSDSSAKSAEIEEIFGKGDHADLLLVEIDDDQPAAAAPQSTVPADETIPVTEEELREARSEAEVKPEEPASEPASESTSESAVEAEPVEPEQVQPPAPTEEGEAKSE